MSKQNKDTRKKGHREVNSVHSIQCKGQIDAYSMTENVHICLAKDM